MRRVLRVARGLLKARSSLENFSQEIVVGDVVLCFASRSTIGAVGVVTGEYEYTSHVPPGVRDDFVNRLPVHWLAKGPCVRHSGAQQRHSVDASDCLPAATTELA